MAFLFRGDNLLAKEESVLKFFPYGIKPTGSLATVGFYQLNGTTIAPSASMYLCMGKKYLLRVWVPDNGTTMGTYLASYNGSLDTFIMKSITSQSDISSLVVFEPVTRMVYSSKPFLAKMYTQGLTGSQLEYSVSVNSAYSQVGYSESLPTYLSNCKACGCPQGSNCNSNGVCSSSPVNPCGRGTACGGGGGRCSGPCPDGYICTNLNGKFSCVKNTSASSIWVGISLLLGMLILFGLLVLIIWLTYKTNKETDINMEKINMAAVQATGGTQIIGL